MQSLKFFKITKLWKFFEKKNYKNNLLILIFHLKIDFYIYRVSFEFEIGCIQLEPNYIFQMQPSELKISVAIESYDEKTAYNYRNCYVVEKRIVFKL